MKQIVNTVCLLPNAGILSNILIISFSEEHTPRCEQVISLYIMKKLHIHICAILILLLAHSCASQMLKKQLKGIWCVEEIVHNGRNILWDQQWISLLVIKEDGSCELPSRDLSINRNARWDLMDNHDIHYLVITNAQDSLFNKEYEIEVTQRQQLSLNVKILELRSKELYLKCSQ